MSRSPAEIFEEVLDAWDDRERGDIRSEHALGTAESERESLAEHLARVEKYREAFAAALGIADAVGRAVQSHGPEEPEP